MDDIERSSPVSSIQPVLKIHARLFNHEQERERRELLYTYQRNRRLKAAKRKKPARKLADHLTPESGTPEEIKQDFIDYKSDLKIRLAFDRAQIFDQEPF